MSEGASAKDEGAPEHINLKVFNSVMGIRLFQENGYLSNSPEDLVV